jgi:hypothetical protein
MGRLVARFVGQAAALAWLVACGADVRGRAVARIDSPGFWPDAPEPSGVGAKHAFEWHLDRFGGYELDEEFVSSMTLGNAMMTHGSSATITSKLSMALRCEPGAASESRDVYVDRLDFKIGNDSLTYAIHSGRDGISVDNGFGMKPYAPGMATPISIPNLGDRLATLVLDDGSIVTEYSTAYGGIDSPLKQLLWPQLPHGHSVAGEGWDQSAEVRPRGAVIATAIHYVYLGDSACPSNRTKRCAQLRFVAAGDSTMRHEITIQGGWAGRVFFDVDDGVVDESRTHVDLELGGGPKASATIRGDIRLRSATARDE